MILVASTSLAGCTTADDEAVADAINTVVQGLGSQAIGFLLDLGRQSLAAILL